MKGELERMEQKLSELKLRKGTLVARAEQAKAAAAPSRWGRGGPDAFEDFRRMESKIEGTEAEAHAMNEVEEALGKGQSEGDLESKFRELGQRTGGPGRAAPTSRTSWRL